jgi:CTP synthase (UTP-ammonia lyase)
MSAVLAKIALIGDYDSEIPAHQAIPLALERVGQAIGCKVAWVWIPTEEVAIGKLAEFNAIWVVPGSPYRDMNRVLDAIHWARETGRPFLGTCGGFQHALIEFSRNVLGMTKADHAETNPHGENLVVTRLACSLVEKTNLVHFAPGSRLRAIYGADSAFEGYHCNYGLNPSYRNALHLAGMNFSAQDDAGDVRAFELPSEMHPFFISTLFQPERMALTGGTPPLVRALVEAAKK